MIEIKEWCGVDARLDTLVRLSFLYWIAEYERTLSPVFILILFIILSLSINWFLLIKAASAKVLNSKHDFSLMPQIAPTEECSSCQRPMANLKTSIGSGTSLAEKSIMIKLTTLATLEESLSTAAAVSMIIRC